MSEVETVLALLLAVAALAALATRLGVPYPILLVIGGAALGFVPELPPIQIDPEAVFLIFVPPLVFAAAFFTSWRDFVAKLRPILSLAVGLVLASTLAIAAVTHLVLGIAWAPALVFGAVVSNTDTTAIVAIAQQVGLPRRVMTILEGESLVNDAMALTAFRIAIVATVTGLFSLQEIGGDFALAVLGALPIGLAVGWLTAAARHRAGDPRIGIIISVLTPYAAYLPADQLGASGILAVVIAGLYVGRRESRIEDAPTRLQARAVWDIFVFGLNGLLFILVGVQLRPVWDALQGQGYEVRQVLAGAAAICLTVILVRIAWVFLIAAGPRWLGVRRHAPLTGVNWRELVIIGWAGLRGGDTLAAALSVPLLTTSGAHFPARAEIIFLAFTVILVTLVGQGLTLPVLIRRLGLADDESEEREERLARRAAAAAALDRLDSLEDEALIPAELVESLRRRYAHQADLLTLDEDPGKSAADHIALHERLQREVLAAQREELLRLRDEGEISDQVLRRVERELDLEEARLEP
jgi:monovalent cation/hydrogen antiporter